MLVGFLVHLLTSQSFTDHHNVVRFGLWGALSPPTDITPQYYKRKLLNQYSKAPDLTSKTHYLFKCVQLLFIIKYTLY
jgi:hypothetical protein